MAARTVLAARSLDEAEEIRKGRPDLAIDILVSPVAGRPIEGLRVSAVYVAPGLDVDDPATRRLLLNLRRRLLTTTGSASQLTYLSRG